MTITDSLAHHIVEDPEDRGPARSRVRDSGVEVWVLVARLPAMAGDSVRLAEAYDLPMEPVDAALAYYRRHKKVIDAQIAVNAAWVAVFYLDHNIARELGDHLRGLGHVAHTTRGVGMERAGDEAHLAPAARSCWTLITHNAGDFRLLHAAWRQWTREWEVEKHHAGAAARSQGVQPTGSAVQL